MSKPVFTIDQLVARSRSYRQRGMSEVQVALILGKDCANSAADFATAWESALQLDEQAAEESRAMRELAASESAESTDFDLADGLELATAHATPAGFGAVLPLDQPDVVL